MSNVEALLNLSALSEGGLAGQGAAPGHLSEEVSGIKIVTPYNGLSEHEHPLAQTDRSTGWTCDVCRSSGEGLVRYRCTEGCDWDMCGECWDHKKAAHDAKHGTQGDDTTQLKRPVVGGGNKKYSNPWSIAAQQGRSGSSPTWAQQNPLAPVLCAKPARGIAEPSGPSGDVEAFLLERHLLSDDGLSCEAMQRACKQLAGAAHSLLASQFANGDKIGKLLKAQSVALKRLEKSIAAELQGRPGVPLFVTTPEPPGTAGVGDTSGLFYYIGTQCGTRPYNNPYGNGLRLTKGGDGTNAPQSSYDYGNGQMLLSNTNGQRVRLYDNGGNEGEYGHPWFQVEITSPDIIGFLPTHYKLRIGDSSEYMLRDWEFSASEDGKEWTALSKGSDHPDAFTRAEQCRTFPTPGAKSFYKCRSRSIVLRRGCSLSPCRPSACVLTVLCFAVYCHRL
eukprot:COSAG02_NODE_571_length_20173_cov_14.694032_2_plen_447_part_00